MIIVSGHLTVAPEGRERYLADCVAVVEAARSTVGCLDFALSADLLDGGRVNVYERWESVEAVEAFRGSGPSDGQWAAILAASVSEYDVQAARDLTG